MKSQSNLATRFSLQRGVDFEKEQQRREWGLRALSGRLVELSAQEGSASITMAATLIRQAQLQGEVAVWIGLDSSCFFPPDMARCGVDLDHLPVMRLPQTRAIPIAADLLVRCGSFALLVLDLGADVNLPLSTLTRLAGLAKHHDTALVLLTEKPRNAPSLGSLVSVRAEVVRRDLGNGRFACEVRVLKDKSQGLPSKHTELRRGPDGLH
ncbi:MAG: recombinase A [Planctomycetota bacterium]